MLANEFRALEIFLDSATFENDFRPMSYALISEKLKEEELSGTKSSVGRWALKYKWDDALNMKRQEAVMALGSKSTKPAALMVLDQQTEVTVKRNSALISDTYDVMEAFIFRVKEDIARGVFRREDIKMAKDIAVLVTGREDKMLDRLAGMGGDRLTSEEMKAERDAIDVEFEDE